MGSGSFQEGERPTMPPAASSSQEAVWNADSELGGNHGQVAEEKIKDVGENRSWKHFKTACLCVGILTLGICQTIIGPALPTIADNLRIRESKLYMIFTARGFGYFFGSLLSGILLQRMSAISLIAISLFINAVGQFVSPLSPNALLLCGVFVLIGFAMGILDTSINVACLLIWGKESEIWMQTTHFCEALGFIISPLIAAPFINEAGNSIRPANLILYAAENLVDERVTRNSTIFTWVKIDGFPDVAWLFTIATVLSALSAISFIYILCVEDAEQHSSEKTTAYAEDKIFRWQMISLLFVVFLLNAGLIVTFGMYLYSYAIHSQRRYEKNAGAAMDDLFMISIALGCFFSIFLANHVSSKSMLVADFVIGTLATTGMSVFSFYWESPDWLLWLSIGLHGLSLANVFPALITWAENFISVDGSAASAFVIGCSSGDMLVPLLVGLVFGQDPNNLMYFSFIANAICVMIFIIVLILVKRHEKQVFKQELASLIPKQR